MAGAATNSYDHVFPLVYPGHSNETYSREEVDNASAVLAAGKRSMLHFAAKVSHVVPCDGMMTCIRYIEAMEAVKVLPFICGAQFWTMIHMYRDHLNEPGAQKSWIIQKIIPIITRSSENPSIQYEEDDEQYIQNIDSVLRAALEYNGGIEIIRILVAVCPFVVTHPKGKTRLLPAHDAMLYDCELVILQELTQLPSVCRHRDACGRTLLHWAILCDMSIHEVEYIFHQFPDAVDCPSFYSTGGVIDPSCLVRTKLDELRGDKQVMKFSDACTPLCLALDVNMHEMQKRDNSLVVDFLVDKSARSCLVPDSTGEIAFHKLLQSFSEYDNFSLTLSLFVNRHTVSAQCVPFVTDTRGHTLLESAFVLRLPGIDIDMIGRFTSNMIEPIVIMNAHMHEIEYRLPIDEHRDERPWSLLLHPLASGESMPRLSSSGLPLMPSNDNKPDHMSDMMTCFIYGEDAIIAANPQFTNSSFHMLHHQTPVQYRKWTQVVVSKEVSNKMMEDIKRYFNNTKVTLSSVLRHLQRDQKTWYNRYKKDLREHVVHASEESILSEHDAGLFFVQRQARSCVPCQRPAVRKDESERHAQELLQSLEDEQNSKQMAASTPSKKARKKLAQQERDVAAQLVALHENEARETALAIAQAAAAALQDRIKVEAEYVRQAVAHAEQRQTEENTARVLTDLEVHIQCMEIANLELRDAAVSFMFDIMRKALLIAQQDIADAVIMQYASNLIVQEMMSVLETEDAINNMLTPQLRDNLFYVLPGLVEREAQREADRVELEALRKIVREDKEARECVICFDNIKNVLLRPCMHMAICHKCFDTKNPTECPICRGVVSGGDVYYT